MTVKLEAILSIEDSLANRLQKTWRKLSKQYKAEVTKALNANDPVAAQEVADSVDMTPVYTENEQYIRMQTYASLMHGATRLTPKPKDTSITTGAYAPAVDKVMLQFKKQITGSATEQVKKTLVNLIAQEFYEAPVEVEVKKYNPHHDPEFEADQWRSTNVLKFDDTQPRWPEGHPKGGQWKETEATSANFVVDDLDAVGMTPNMYDYHRDADYFRESRGLVTKIVWMSPDAYLQEGAEILAENSRGRSTAEEVLAQRRENTDTIDWLADALKNGPRKVAMPYLDRRKKRRGQEGMHRSLAAKKLGLTAIPVMLIEDAKVTLQKYDGRHYLSMDDILVAKYDKNQPRYPKGHPKGGQWMKGGGSSGFNPGMLDDFVDSLVDGSYEDEDHPEFQSHEPDGDALVRALGGDPAAILQRLVDRQAAFMQDENNRGIRVDAQLEGDVYPMEEFTKMLDFFPDHSIEHFVLEQGEAFDVPGTPPRIDLMTPKECFSNAAQLTAMTFSDDGKYDYVEGYVIDRKLPFPIHHAWLVDNNTNKVVDPTLGWRPTAAYYGIRMKRTYVRRKLVENGYYGILTDGMRPNDIVLGTDEDFDYK